MTKLRLTDFDLRLSYTATAVIAVTSRQLSRRISALGRDDAEFAWGEAGVTNAMSALGQKQTCRPQSAMSALPPKADIG